MEIGLTQVALTLEASFELFEQKLRIPRFGLQWSLDSFPNDLGELGETIETYVKDNAYKILAPLLPDPPGWVSTIGREFENARKQMEDWWNKSGAYLVKLRGHALEEMARWKLGIWKIAWEWNPGAWAGIVKWDSDSWGIAKNWDLDKWDLTKNLPDFAWDVSSIWEPADWDIALTMPKDLWDGLVDLDSLTAEEISEKLEDLVETVAKELPDLSPSGIAKRIESWF
jgi:hypothetical protein